MDIFVGSLFLGGSGSNIRVEEETSGNNLAFMTTGTYWFHGDSTFGQHESNDQLNEVGEYPGLFREMEIALSDGAANTYVVDLVTHPDAPSTSTNVLRGSVFRITAANEEEPFRLHSQSHEFDLRQLGFDDGDTTLWSDDPDSGGSDYQIIASTSVPYRWEAHTLFGGGPPSERRSWQERQMSFSDEDLQRAYGLHVVSRTFRDLEYEYVSPHAVFGSRAGTHSYIEEGGYAEGDVTASFEFVWEEASRDARGDLLGLDPILVIYDVDSFGNDDAISTWHHIRGLGSGWEALQPSSHDWVTEYESVWAMMSLKGELYRFGPSRFFIEYSEYDF